MTWFDALPAALATLAWVLLPGLVLTYLIGLRGVAAWALAPVVSIALIASTAVVVAKLGLDWSVLNVLVVCAACALIAGGGAFLLRRRSLLAPDRDPRRVSLFAAAGLVPALLLCLVTVGQAIARPDALSQTYDAVFHYNALAYIQDSHLASSLTLGSLGTPGVPGVFYPAAWHDLASLVMMSTGAAIPVAANMVAIVATAVIWPLSCLLLVRQLFGRNAGALAITGVLSVGFTAFPWDLLGFGVLWPNLLGLAFAPACLAVVLTLTGWARDDAIGTGRGWLVLPVGLLATGFTHPNVLFSVAVLALFPIAAALVRRALALRRDGSTWRGVAEVGAFVAIVGIGWWWSATTPAFEDVRTMWWAPFETPANAVGDVMLNATHRNDALWILSVVVLAGIVACRRFPVLWLIVAGHAVSTFLYVLTASINRLDTQKFTGYWYNDSHRLAAMLPITAVPLAVGGILFLTTKLLTTSTNTTADAPRWRQRVAGIPAAAVAVGLTVVLVGVTGGLYPADRAARVRGAYWPAFGQVVPQSTQEFIAEIKTEIPPDSLVAGNPFNGSGMLWALGDRRVLYPHFTGVHSPDQVYLAQHLTTPDVDLTKACDATRRLGVDYLLVGAAEYRKSDGMWNYYRGVDDPGSKPGFVLVDSSGDNKLYRLAVCEPAASP